MTNGPVFHIDLLKNYQVLDRPGTFIVNVAYDVTDNNLYLKDNYPRYLIPLRVVRSEELPNLIKFIKDVGGTVPFYTIKDYFLTGALFDNGDIDIDALPIKGEEVVATFDYVKGKLHCTHIKLIDRDKLMYINFSAIDELYALAEKFISK
jgi:hypothetical protein